MESTLQSYWHNPKELFTNITSYVLPGKAVSYLFCLRGVFQGPRVLRVPLIKTVQCYLQNNTAAP